MTNKKARKKITYCGDYVTSVCTNSTIFYKPIDVLAHMFTVNSNGVDYRNFDKEIGEVYLDNGDNVKYRYYSFDGSVYSTLKVETPLLINEFDATYPPFIKYRKCREEIRSAIKNALEYFIKCIESSTYDSVKAEYENSNSFFGVLHRRKSEDEKEQQIQYCWKLIQEWQENIQLLKNELSHL